MSQTAAPKPGFGAWYSAIMLFLLTAVSMADRHVIAMLAGPIKADLGLGDFQLSLLVGFAFASFYTVFAYPFGWAADRWPRPWIIAIAVGLWSLAAAGSGLVSGFALLFTMRALVGVGEAGLSPAGASLLADQFPKERLTLPMAIQFFGIPVGAAIGVVGAGYVLTASPGWDLTGWPILNGLKPWQLAFVLIGLPGLIFAALALTLPEPRRGRAAPKGEAVPLMPFLKENWKTIAPLVFGMGMAAMSIQNISTWTPEYLSREFGADPLSIGAKMGGISFLAALFGQIGSAVLVDRLSKRGVDSAPSRYFRWLLIIVVPVAVAAFWVRSENGFFIALFFMMLLLMPALPLGVVSMQMLAPPALRSRLAALYAMTVNLLAFGVGPSLVGALSQYGFGEDRLGVALGVSVVGCVIVSVLLLGVAIKRMALAARG